MSAKDERSGVAADRHSLGFAESVKNAFSFLAANFHVAEAAATFVRYESDKMFLNVYHGRQSYEVGVEVGCLHDAEAYRYRLPEVLGAFLGEARHQNDYYFQASDRDGVRRCVEAAASLVEQHYGAVLEADPFALKRVKTFTSERNDEYTREVVQQPTRDSAERAWQEKDYPTVAQLYGSIRSDLTPVERKRMEYAEKQIRA